MAASLRCRYSCTPGSAGRVKGPHTMRHSSQRTPKAELDRRRSSRTFGCTRPGRTRRRANRTHTFDEVFWRREDDAKCRRGILVGVSQTGLALVTEHGHAIRAGMPITPNKDARNGRWSEPVVVTRVDRLSDMLDLVAAEYPSPAPAIVKRETWSRDDVRVVGSVQG